MHIRASCSRLLTVGFVGLSLASAGFAIQDNGGPPPKFQRAYKLAEDKRYAEALELLDQILKSGENSRNALFSGGAIAMLAGQFERARTYLNELKNLEPRSGRVRAALVRASQAVGDLPARDAERAELIRLRNSGEDPELKTQEYYLRDEFKVGPRTVHGLELFELKGEYALRYAFLVFQPGREQPESASPWARIRLRMRSGKRRGNPNRNPENVSSTSMATSMRAGGT